VSDGVAQADLLAPLEASPADLARPIGQIDGPPGWAEGFGAGLRVWCGPLHGWRDFGELLGDPPAGGLLWHRGRLSVGLSWDLGRAILRRGIPIPDDDEPEAQPETCNPD
jgi:hypothetical protein